MEGWAQPKTQQNENGLVGSLDQFAFSQPGKKQIERVDHFAFRRAGKKQIESLSQIGKKQGLQTNFQELWPNGWEKAVCIRQITN